jgi:hypothetical protein
VFRLNTDGSGFTMLHQFNLGGWTFNTVYGLPFGVAGNTVCVYPSTAGTSVFALNTDGTGFRTVSGVGYFGGRFAISGNVLYGFGGSSVLSEQNMDGTALRRLPCNLSGLTGNLVVLVADGTTLYGATAYQDIAVSGSIFGGTIFSISLPASPPQLTIGPARANVTLTWPTNATGLTLQFTTNLTSPVAWSPVSAAPVVVNGQNTVTNGVSGAAQFFRLAQ